MAEPAAATPPTPPAPNGAPPKATPADPKPTDAKPDPKAEAKPGAPAKPTEAEREREEARRANEQARKAARERDEHGKARAELEAKLKARDEEGAALRKLAREDPAKAIQQALGITYAEATKLLLAKGGGKQAAPAPNPEIAELKAKLEALEKGRAEETERAKQQHDLAQTENVYAKVTAFAASGENAEKYELTLYEAKADPVRYRALFRRFVDAEVAEGRDPTEADVLEAFETELLTREQKRASLKKLRGIYSGPGSTTEQPAAKKGTTATSDVPRTLTQEQTVERVSGGPKRSRAEIEAEEESQRLARAAEVLRNPRR